MDCKNYRLLIDADIDGELDLIRHLELAEHARACPDCARYAEAARARHTALRGALPRFIAPPQLADKIRSALQAEGAPNTATEPVARRTPGVMLFWNLAGVAASLAFALLIGFGWGEARARRNLLIDEAVNEHIRSLQAAHLIDVISSDQHTVKPWFAGKLDFAPPVADLAAAGFPLAGGRLEHIDGRPAAALVFHRRAHAINLFIWPVSTGAIAARQSCHNGYNAESWSQGSLNFLAVSEIPAPELAEFAATFRASQH
jgi:anti-sigma factor RsiW